MKKRTAFVLVLVWLLSFAGCSGKTVTFDICAADRICVQSGLSGKQVNITDSETIQRITRDINALTFQSTSVPCGNGYAYMLTWFDANDSKIAEITVTEESGYRISHDGYYCEADGERGIDTGLIAELLDSAE